jgi:hypothetical protein
MSTSIIEYKGNSFWENDSLLVIVSYYLMYNLNIMNSPDWFIDYIKDDIDTIYQVKPIGYSNMNLDKVFDDEIKKNYFLDYIDTVIEFIDSSNSKVIDVGKINKILRMKETEGYELKKSKIEKSVIITILNRIKELLLEISISTKPTKFLE